MTNRPPGTPGRFLLASALALGASAPVFAFADPNGGTVSGSVSLASPQERGEPPVTSEGFVPRARNPLKAPVAFDPRPQLVAVLVGGNAEPGDTKPPGSPVRFKIIGESFEADILPVVVGSKVEFRNEGRNSPRLYSPDNDGFVPGDPISPKGRRDTVEIDTPLKAYEIRDRESAHLSSRVVAFPHKYFSTIGADGSFEIPDVSPGEWKLRFWYRDGWVEMPQESVTVTAKRATKLKPVAIPGRIARAAPTQAAPTQAVPK